MLALLLAAILGKKTGGSASTAVAIKKGGAAAEIAAGVPFSRRLKAVGIVAAAAVATLLLSLL